MSSLDRSRPEASVIPTAEAGSSTRRATAPMLVRTVERMTAEHLHHPANATDDTLATASVILGVLGLLPVPGLPAAIAAMICGGVAWARDGRSGRATAGLLLGLVGVLLPVAFLVVYCGILGYPFPIHRYRG
jgi:hypothetical protein